MSKELEDKYEELLGYEMPAQRHTEYFKKCAEIAIDHAKSEMEAFDRWKADRWWVAKVKWKGYIRWSTDGTTEEAPFSDLYELYKQSKQ